MALESVERFCLFKKFIHVTTARKDDKNRQNRLFLCLKEMNLVPNTQFESTKDRKKRNVCGQQSTRDYWSCVLSNMFDRKVCLHFNQ